MKTLLNGIRLPCHEEFYKVFPKFKGKILIKFLNLDLGICLHNDMRNRLRIGDNYENHNISKINFCDILSDIFWKDEIFEDSYEKNDWDIYIKIDCFNNSLSDKDTINYFIEYKCSIDEWGKGIQDFLNQIEKRKSKCHMFHNSKHKRTLLLTFDDRFLQYDEILKKNNIELNILNQSLLKK